MRLPLPVFGALMFALTASAACGTTIRPHVGTGGNQPPGMQPGGRFGPRSGPGNNAVEESRSAVDQVCRVQATRAGWIVTRYLQGGENCPEPTDPGNPYTVAVIEQITHKPVGTTMIVCADQAIPREWVRDHDPDVRATCEGARVREGSATVMVIRRVSVRQ